MSSPDERGVGGRQYALTSARNDPERTRLAARTATFRMRSFAALEHNYGMGEKAMIVKQNLISNQPPAVC
jgi:hypothetical protein